MLSTLSSSLPYFGKSPSISKSIAIPFSSLIGLTLAYLIAERESVATENPAFMGKDELTPAQRGTLAHKFLEKCDFNLVENSIEKESVVLQGIMDGLIINGNIGEIIDYKTDRVETEEELCDRYREQMRVYKAAAEQCFGLENVTVTLYSFSLSKEISIKL